MHDKLPKTFVPYLRELGKRRGRSGSPARTGRGGTDPTKRWATKYCWEFADGKYKKTAEECGRPHLTEEEAKAKAEGKTLCDEGYDPNKRGPKNNLPCLVGPVANATANDCHTPAPAAGEVVASVKNALASMSSESSRRRE